MTARSQATGAWPNLFVVGAAKAGTTALHNALSRRNEISMSRLKEPHFFSRPLLHPDAEGQIPVIRDERRYLSLFDARMPIRGESSTSYLPSAEAATRIRAASPDARIVILLRDPVQRAYSHYLNDVRDGRERRPFPATLGDLGEPDERWGSAASRLRLSLYAEDVRRYLELFGKRVAVLVSEEIADDPAAALRELEDLLALQRDPAWTLEHEHPSSLPRNALAARALAAKLPRRIGRRVVPRRGRAFLYSLALSARKPGLDPGAARELWTYYRDDVRALEQLLGRQLPWPVTHERG